MMRRKLIEVALPLEAINVASAREKSIRHGHPSTLHLWWARRPLAACRAVLFGQLVDDPSAWQDLYPGEEAQDRERQRLFALIEQLVQWENSNNVGVIGAARLEIARSIARGRKADRLADARDDEILQIRDVAFFATVREKRGVEMVEIQALRIKELPERDSEAVNRYLGEVAPPVHDPFAGGGSIPLEAQRLGLRAIATDLNPVAVLINKALIEIPANFAGRPPINPLARDQKRKWTDAQGLADDVRYYGQWMRDEAFRRIGHLYPPVKITNEMVASRGDLKKFVGEELTVIAWLWVRTVASPNPACDGTHVPLVTSFWLSKKPGKETSVEPVVDRANNQWSFKVRVGKPGDLKTVDAGTKTGRGDFRCILSGDPIPGEYIRKEGQAGRIRDRLMAIVAEGHRGRVYLDPLEQQERTARVQEPEGSPDTDLPEQALGFRVQNYGMKKHRYLFTPRQLTAMVTFCDLVSEAIAKAVEDGSERAYADAVGVYLGMAVSRMADMGTMFVQWSNARDQAVHTFGRQILAMVWDFSEVNPYAGAAGDITIACESISKSLGSVMPERAGVVIQQSAQDWTPVEPELISTDPPYYDNVPYADLSDFFYVWLRRSLQPVLPDLFRTMLVPKASELIAEPFRHGGKEAAEAFFMEGMTLAIRRMREALPDEYPAAIYYAFKQAETSDEATSSTGWETFLQAIINAGFSIDGTWPVRTERPGRLRETGSNALASSIVLVCRKRLDEAPIVTGADLRRLLRTELPAALKALQKSNIAPVDLAQASIGPGMAIFSRHSKVLESDGSPMAVRMALQLINQALDEYLTEQEGEFDGDTRFALTWFETRQYEAGPFGEAETLAKARNVSVAGVVEAGILASAAGKVRILRRNELPDDWSPETDKRMTVWEAAQHLIWRLENKGELAAADLLAHLRAKAAPARDLAYRLYTTCERKGWAEEARSYNGLVVAWPELQKLAAGAMVTVPVQETLL